MSRKPNESTSGAEEARLIRQRDQALVCAILAVVISGGIGWSNFGREYPGLRESREAVLHHHASLTEHEGLMTTIRSLLLDSRKVVEQLRQTRSDS